MDNPIELKNYQQKIIDRLLGKFNEINQIDIASVVAQDAMVCRNCNSTHFVKNGVHKGHQRYKCKTCQTTQFLDANTSLYNLKLKDKWVDFVLIMLERDQPTTCKKISEELEINIKTAHYWRHKFLSAINQTQDITVGTEVELDEIYLPFCVKGRIGKEKYESFVAPGHPDNIESQLRKDEKTMESECHQVIYMCTHNRMGDFDFNPIKIQKKGIVSEEAISKVLSTMDLEAKTVITDSEPSMKAYFKNKENISHRTFKSSDTKQGVLKEKNVHNNNINNTMMRLKKWLNNFYGISTKYCLNYLKWFRFRDSFELETIRTMIRKSVVDRRSYSRFKDIFSAYKNFVYA